MAAGRRPYRSLPCVQIVTGRRGFRPFAALAVQFSGVCSIHLFRRLNARGCLRELSHSRKRCTTTKIDGANSTARQVEAIMPLNTAMPIDQRGAGAGAGRDYQGRDAEDERKRGHDDRTEPRARRVDGGFRDRLVLVEAVRPRATSTIRIAFLAESAIKRMIPIWV